MRKRNDRGCANDPLSFEKNHQGTMLRKIWQNMNIPLERMQEPIEELDEQLHN
jgi:hypothetical protein